LPSGSPGAKPPCSTCRWFDRSCRANSLASITLSEQTVATLGARWRALEAEADLSFFQSWTWIGCLADERFSHPVLLEVEQAGRTVALALLNRTGPLWERERLYLGESGQPGLDAVFVEYNGPLLARGCADLLPSCLRALLEQPIAPRSRRYARRVRLSGVDETQLRAARMAGSVRVLQSRPVRFVDFNALAGGETRFLDSLSANARHQIRRSKRCYEEAGPLRVRRAASVDEALAFLEVLVRLHQITWTSRGRPGAFADPVFMRFHRELIARGVPRGEVDLLRIDAGEQPIGLLYNFVFRGRISAYQSGFDYAAAGPHQKPGLTCHCAAIAAYRVEGAAIYDFLAGNERYKMSLGNAETTLHWVDVAPFRSMRGVLTRWMTSLPVLRQ
jgi:CelD/BcsL family acetyltransferase involved in cellulose biosynthesis